MILTLHGAIIYKCVEITWKVNLLKYNRGNQDVSCNFNTMDKRINDFKKLKGGLK